MADSRGTGSLRWMVKRTVRVDVFSLYRATMNAYDPRTHSQIQSFGTRSAACGRTKTAHGVRIVICCFTVRGIAISSEALV